MITKQDIEDMIAKLKQYGAKKPYFIRITDSYTTEMSDEQIINIFKDYDVELCYKDCIWYKGERVWTSKWIT